MKTRTPHPDLFSLLEKHNLTLEEFWKTGRGAATSRERRSNLVSDLHSQGTTWARMMEITGLSLSGIQSLTRAMWNPASRENSKECGRKTGHTWKGKKRPGQLERQWKNGTFEHLRGQTLSEERKAKLRESVTPERREKMSTRSKKMWEDPSLREHLLLFHRSPEERQRRSLLQAQRIQDDPVKWLRGKGGLVSSPKCREGREFWVRSSYEKQAVSLLTQDPRVKSFEFEPRLISGGRTILPDFLVDYGDVQKLIEVKSAWVLSLPEEDKVVRRLNRARECAKELGIPFEIWTEKELGLC